MVVIRSLAVIVAAASLAACAVLGGRWVDTSGQHRSQGRAKSDYKVCTSEAGMAGPGQASDYDKSQAEQKRLITCMYSRGWRDKTLTPL
jgi:hypothetical protein